MSHRGFKHLTNIGNEFGTFAVLCHVTARSLILHLNTSYNENYWDRALRLLPWWDWGCLFCGIYAWEKFYHNTHTLYGPSYVSINTPCDKILDHIVHRETPCFCCQHSCQYSCQYLCRTCVHVDISWTTESAQHDLSIYIFNSIRHYDVGILPTWCACVAHKYQDIVFQTQKTIPTLTHGIVLARLTWNHTFTRPTLKMSSANMYCIVNR